MWGSRRDSSASHNFLACWTRVLMIARQASWRPIGETRVMMAAERFNVHDRAVCCWGVDQQASVFWRLMKIP